MKYSKTRMTALIGIGLLVLMGAFLVASKGPSVASAQALQPPRPSHRCQPQPIHHCQPRSSPSKISG